MAGTDPRCFISQGSECLEREVSPCEKPLGFSWMSSLRGTRVRYAACPEEAIIKHKSDGLVLVDAALCTGCETCLDACPYGVPQFGPDGIMEKCDLCIDQAGREYGPPCVMTCPGGALSLREVTPGEKEGHQKTILALKK